MSQAIQTTYRGPTKTRGARIIAKSFSQKISLAYEHKENGKNNHHAAAKALAAKFNWSGHWVVGGAPDGRGNVYVKACRVAEPAPENTVFSV